MDDVDCRRDKQQVRKHNTYLTSLPSSTKSRTFSAEASSSFCSLEKPRFSFAFRSSTKLFSRSKSFARSSLHMHHQMI